MPVIKLSFYRKLIIGFGIGFLGYIVTRRLLQQKAPIVYILDRSEDSYPKLSDIHITKATDQTTSKPMDDLEIIYGIGPKIKSVLNQSGITTFSELQAVDRITLQKILQDGGIRIAKIETWQEQARLAADQRWDDLQNLQQKIKQAKE